MGTRSSQLSFSNLVTVTKLLAKKTPLTNENLNSSFAKGDFSAASLVAKSILPLISSLLTMNFIVAGFGVDSVYTLMFILFFPNEVTKLNSFLIYIVILGCYDRLMTLIICRNRVLLLLCF